MPCPVHLHEGNIGSDIGSGGGDKGKRFNAESTKIEFKENLVPKRAALAVRELAIN